MLPTVSVGDIVRQKCLQKGRYKVLPSFKNTKIRESVTSDNLIDTFLTPLRKQITKYRS